MNNLDFWNRYRSVPKEAQKQITGGRLKGMTDIEPMWRLKCLTEEFGMCGVGWGYTPEPPMFQPTAEGEVACFVTISLWFIKDGEIHEVSGTGGSMFVANEKGGLHTNDECVKMATTDAISVACKNLGMGADVYWGKGLTKYGKYEQSTSELICKKCGKPITDLRLKDGTIMPAQGVADRWGGFCGDCLKEAEKARSAE